MTRLGRVGFATIDLLPADYEGYYRGFSNGMLWPLFHYRIGLAEFRREDHAAYRRVNETFAAALAPLLRPGDLVWVHDYHLIPLGAALRRRGFSGRLGFFLHVPFPSPAIYEALPQGDALLADFAAYDVIGLQTDQDATNLNTLLARATSACVPACFRSASTPHAFAREAAAAAEGPEGVRLRESLADRALDSRRRPARLLEGHPAALSRLRAAPEAVPGASQARHHAADRAGLARRCHAVSRPAPRA